jgi:hypothetical protein
MQDIVVVFIIIIILSYLLFRFIFGDNKEHYETSTVGYNSIKIPDYKIDSLFDTETKELDEVFKVAFKDDNIEPIGFKIHNPYIPFPFDIPIKKLIINYLKNNIDKFKNNKLEIMNNISKIYYKDIGNDRIFIFNVSIINNTKFMTRNLRVKIKLKDIIKFMKDNIDNTNIDKKGELTDYRTNISVDTIINAIELLSIRLDNNNYAIFKLTGIDSLTPELYEIKNRLGLMDPFLTSERDMIITEKMNKDFINKYLL